MEKKEINKKSPSLSNEEKLDLWNEFIKTGEKLTYTTKYKGYNIYSMRNNIRQLYYNDKLHIDQKLLERFIESGLISKKRERKRKSSVKQKYDFLIETVGKSREELASARMENGLSYYEVRHELQLAYNKNELDLNSEQIKNLKENGILTYSAKEKQELLEKFKFPVKYVIGIEKKYGSFEVFYEKYKKGEVDYKFQNDIFCGYRGILLSEKDITESKKLVYSNLVKKILEKKSYRYSTEFNKCNISIYIDIDRLEKVLYCLNNKTQKTIRMRYGLDGKVYTLEECKSFLGVAKQTIANWELKALRILGDSKLLDFYLSDIKKDEKNLEDFEEEYSSFKELIEKCEKEEENKKKLINKTEGLEEILIIDLDLSNFAKTSFLRSGIKTVLELINKSEEDLRGMRFCKRAAVAEVKLVLEKMGLRLRNENEKVNPFRYF